jgi:hypothetical protein
MTKSGRPEIKCVACNATGRQLAPETVPGLRIFGGTLHEMRRQRAPTEAGMNLPEFSEAALTAALDGEPTIALLHPGALELRAQS